MHFALESLSVDALLNGEVSRFTVDVPSAYSANGLARYECVRDATGWTIGTSQRHAPSAPRAFWQPTVSHLLKSLWLRATL